MLILSITNLPGRYLTPRSSLPLNKTTVPNISVRIAEVPGDPDPQPLNHDRKLAA
jgi:hypothetical protein